MTAPTIAGVIFDMDGVLIDSSDAHLQSWHRLASEFGRQVTEEQFRTTFGRQNRDIIPILFGDTLEADRIEELSEKKELYYRELIKDDVPALPGAAELVRACHRAGWRCAIGSSGHPENIALAMRALGIESLITGVVTGKDVTIGKPNPQVFLLAAERLGLAPQCCAVIEDAPAGIDAALAAGMTAIAVTTEHPRERLIHAHLVVDRLDELTPDRIAQVAHR